MAEVGAYEAKTHLSRLLERVRKGERITITKHGTPIATLVPVETKTQRTIAATIEEIRRFRREHRLDGLTIRELIEEGRR